MQGEQEEEKGESEIKPLKCRKCGAVFTDEEKAREHANPASENHCPFLFDEKPRQQKKQKEPPKETSNTSSTPVEETRSGEDIYKFSEPEQTPYDVLKEVLESCRLNKDMVEEVMSWAKYKEILQPAELEKILLSFKGMHKERAEMIVSKYIVALEKYMRDAGRESEMIEMRKTFDFPRESRSGGMYPFYTGMDVGGPRFSPYNPYPYVVPPVHVPPQKDYEMEMKIKKIEESIDELTDMLNMMAQKIQSGGKETKSEDILLKMMELSDKRNEMFMQMIMQMKMGQEVKPDDTILKEISDLKRELNDTKQREMLQAIGNEFSEKLMQVMNEVNSVRSELGKVASTISVPPKGLSDEASVAIKQIEKSSERFETASDKITKLGEKLIELKEKELMLKGSVPEGTVPVTEQFTEEDYKQIEQEIKGEKKRGK